MDGKGESWWFSAVAKIVLRDFLPVSCAYGKPSENAAMN